jgi:hypothetical protein
MFHRGIRLGFGIGLATLAGACAVEVGGAESEPVSGYDDEVALATAALESESFGAVSAEEFPEFGVSEIREQLPLLRDEGVALVLHWPSAALDASDARWDLVAEAQQMGITVKPWLTLPEGTGPDEGYFPNSTNYAAFIERARELIERWDDMGLEPSTFYVDMELRKDRLDAVLEAQARGAQGDSVNMLASYVDRDQFADARRAYARFVSWAHSYWRHPRGPWKVQVTTLPQLIDDYTLTDWDDDLAQAFNCPIAGIDWDVVSFMTFRTLFGDLAGQELTSYFVYDYARHARQRYGDRAGVSVGLTAPGVTTGASTYDSGDVLREDIEAALRAGIRRENIEVYSLQGIVDPDNAPISQWFPAARRPWLAPLPDSGTVDTHATYWTLDGLLTLATIGK